MAKLVINIGQTANDKSGDPLRTAFDKINQNFTELYPQLVPTNSAGKPGDVAGMTAHDNTYFYYCIASYVATIPPAVPPNIWKRVAWSSDTW